MMIPHNALTILVLAIVFLLVHVSHAQKFDPYQLNGGLVTAVAGKDYVLLASDTRLTDGGYGINSRRYLSGRIWSASSSSSLSTFSSVKQNDDSVGGVSDAPLSSSSSILSSWKRFPAQWESDGSLVIPSSNSINNYDSTKIPTITQQQSDSKMIDSSYLQSRTQRNNNLPPIMIGSAGCASDCESLKRRVRLELDALECSSPFGSLGVQSVANLLQQVLYGRRGFPFYSFCVVAGIDQEGSHNGSSGSGAVYVYDAIGSYERVAVASAGTGRELMQPILDRLFSHDTSQKHIVTDNQQIESSNNAITRDAMAVSAGKQRMGVAGSLHPPVQTTVNCSWEEAVSNVARAYQSVAEREISVGDEIVICVVDTSKTKEEDGDPNVGVFSYPLKKH